MARLYTSKRGRSSSTRPISKKTPAWCNYTPEEVEALVLKLSKEGNSPSTIGVLLRDRYAVPLVRSITGKSVLEILSTSQQTEALPEDLRTDQGADRGVWTTNRLLVELHDQLFDRLWNTIPNRELSSLQHV